MVGARSYFRVDINSITDRNGLVHCWGCGGFLPAIRRRGDRPTYLCVRCHHEYSKARERETERGKRLRDSVRFGQLPGSSRRG
jgi:hypothetical protein